jgi:hypothetical protein
MKSGFGFSDREIESRPLSGVGALAKSGFAKAKFVFGILPVASV